MSEMPVYQTPISEPVKLPPRPSPFLPVLPITGEYINGKTNEIIFNNTLDGQVIFIVSQSQGPVPKKMLYQSLQ